jgi:hypothetical protein
MTNSISIKNSLKIAKIPTLFFVSMATCSCTLESTGKSMDISDVIKKDSDLDRFIYENFDSVEYDTFQNPLLSYRVNFVNKTGPIRFCTMNIQQCWVKKAGRMYAFFMLIKKSAEVERHISDRYGKWEVRGDVSTKDGPIGNNLFMWTLGDVKIDISTYLNTFRDPRYEFCELVICRNMTHSQMMDMSEGNSLH